MGSFIPATGTVPIFDGIYCRVGAGDTLMRGRSTFMNEMIETSAICKSVTHQSLCLMDELGRGTSHEDGFAIAWALMSFLKQTGCYCLFATHYHDLTTFKGAVCYYVDMAKVDGQYMPLYQIKKGISGTSHGIEIAQACGYPDSIIERAMALRQ